MMPIEIKMIPHDGGPCPVDGRLLVKRSDDDLIIIDNANKGDLSSYATGFYDVYELEWSEIIAYCPIEIKEG